MSKTCFRMRATRERAAEVLLYDDIGEGFLSEGTTAKAFATELKALGSVDLINVRINSAGGSVFDGIAIYNTLARHGARVEVDIDGMALSIASVIAMAGHEIRIADNAMMMVHNPYTGLVGDATRMRKMADELDSVKENIVGTYAKRTALAPQVISELMDAETWMTGSDAVELKFADRVTVGAMVMNRAPDLARYGYRNAGRMADALRSLQDERRRQRLASLSARFPTAA